MKSVGIDIGSSSIKVAEITQTNKGLVVTSFQEHLLGQNPAFDSEIEILEFLKSLVAKYPAEQWKIVVGLRQEKVSVRNKIFPFADRLKIIKSLPFELEEDLPFSPENAIYDAKIVRIMGQSAEVLACVTPKSKVAEVVQKMEDVGLQISLLSSEAVAIGNCIERWNDPVPFQPGTQLQIEGTSRPERLIEIVVHIGHTRTIICAFEQQSLIGVRSVLWGAKNIAELMAKKYELSFVQAMKELKKSFILLSEQNATYDQVVFSSCIAEATHDLVRELKVTLLEFQSEFNGKLMNVVLTGGGSQVQNLHAYLTTQLEVPVNLFSPLSQFQSTSFQPTTEIDAACAIALGLAIEGLRKPKNPALDFLKQEFQKQNQRLQKLWQSWGTVLQLVAASFVVFAIYSVLREQLATSLADTATEAISLQAKEVAKIPAKQANEPTVRKYIKEQRKKIQAVKNLENLVKMNSALDILRKISDALPGKNNITLNVQRISIQSSRLEIEGSVAKIQELSLLQNALQQLSTNNKVDVLRVSDTKFAYGLNVDRQFVSLSSAQPKNGVSK